jgi:BirA family biotin operon repressor/biotin-[acetyl-CoA-carboxylase] ligase
MATAQTATATPLPHSGAGWTLHVVEQVGSTNTAARTLSAWHALRANTQTEGRGRTGRPWTSDQGGLWISAVLPCAGERSRWAILPLAAGWAIIAALRELGARDLRLRWPNDIMVGGRKLAGLLVERYHADSAVIGIGVNVFNAPESASPDLSGITTRLADLVPGGYTLDDITVLVLRCIRDAHALIRDDRFAEIAQDLNRHWASPRRVAVTLTGCDQPLAGTFSGIDASGRLHLTTVDFGSCYYDAAQISLLRELE